MSSIDEQKLNSLLKGLPRSDFACNIQSRELTYTTQMISIFWRNFYLKSSNIKVFTLSEDAVERNLNVNTITYTHCIQYGDLMDISTLQLVNLDLKIYIYFNQIINSNSLAQGTTF